MKKLFKRTALVLLAPFAIFASEPLMSNSSDTKDSELLLQEEFQVENVRKDLAILTKNHPEILASYDQNVQYWEEAGLPMERMLRTVRYAAVKHRNQTKNSIDQTPYIIHPLQVSEILYKEGNVKDPNVLVAALLHNTVEDTDASFEEIDEIFGADISSIVQELTDDESLSKEEQKQLQISNSLNKSHEAKLVNLADKLHNLRSLKNNPPVDWDQERISAYFVWAEQVIEGLKGTNPDLENQLNDLIAQNK